MTNSRSAWLVAGSALLGSCTMEPLYSSHRVHSQREAGSFHFSVVAVAPWDSSVRNLQPTFQLSEAEALDQVLATTRTVEESIRHTSETDLSVGKERLSPPPDDGTGARGGAAGDDGSDGDASGADGADENDAGSTDGGQWGGGNATPPPPQTGGPAAAPPTAWAPPPRVVAPPVDLVKLADLLGLDPHPLDFVNKDKQDSDPLMRYWAATSLYQEVHLLSQSLRSALVRHGYRAYIVRLKLTLLPNARREPYDALCSLSFFTGGKDPDHETRLPQVVPVLVTDDLERSKHSKVVDNTQEIAAALKYLEPLTTTNASVSDVLNKIQSVSGHDINSLFTVTRITDNTLGVRLGAVQQAEAEFAMVAQNHTVTALLLVPAGDGPEIDVLADARFVDVETGSELAGSSLSELDREAAYVLERRGFGDVDAEARDALVTAIRWNDWPAYKNALHGAAQREVPRRAAVELWQEISMLATRSGTSITTFDLPTTVQLAHAAQPNSAATPQIALATDDGERTVVALRTGSIPFDSEVDVVLHVGPEDSRVAMRPQSAQFDPVNQSLEFHFDSLQAWNLTAQIARTRGAGLSLDLVLNGTSTSVPCLYRGGALPAAPGEPGAGVDAASVPPAAADLAQPPK